MDKKTIIAAINGAAIMMIAGIDPGLDTAAIAVLEVSSAGVAVRSVARMPRRPRHRAKPLSILPDMGVLLPAMGRALSGVDLVVIEQTQGVPGRSATAMHQLGVSFGLYAGLTLACCEAPVLGVKSQHWRVEFGLRGGGKDAGYAVLGHLADGGAPFDLGRALDGLDDHCVDAICLALYGGLVAGGCLEPFRVGLTWLRT